MQKTLGMVLSFFLSVAASAQPFFDASLKDPESLLVYTQTHPDFVRKSLKFRHDGADGFVEPYRSLFLALDLNDLPGTVRGQYKTVRMIYCSDIVSQVTAPFINGIIMKIFASPYISTSDAGCNITDDGDLYLPVGIISQQHYNAVWAHLAAIPELVDFLGGERFDLHVESFPEH